MSRRLQAAGKSLDTVAHLTVYLRDIDDWRRVEPILVTAFRAWTPALTVLESPLPAPINGALIALTAIAWFGSERPAIVSS